MIVKVCRLCSSVNIVLYLKGKNFTIYKCNDCTNGWTDPAPNVINYAERDFHQCEISEKSDVVKKIMDLPTLWQNSIRKQIKLIQRHLPAGSSILEIGCGEGILLKELSNRGYITFGVEPSLTATKRATDQGLNVIQGYFPADELRGKKYDLILMTHVFEHLAEPLEILKAVKVHLAPQGKLLFVQTYFPGFVPKLLGERWYAWLPNQHFWHFTPAGLIAITRDFDFIEAEREFSSLVYYNREKHTLTNFIFLLLEKSFRFFPDKWKDQFHLILSLKS